MRYNPDIHHRRSVRLKDYDYSRAGLYFVTICCDERKYRVGRIENGKMIMNEYGITAYNEWLDLAKRFDQIEMDVFQIMPNHIHGIIAIGVGATLAVAQIPGAIGVGATLAVAQNPGAIGAGASPARTQIPGATPARTVLGDIVGAYKSLVANACLKMYKSNNQTMGKLWQRNYWEHIIRNEQDLSHIRHYIENNPVQWEYDKLNGESGNRVLETPAEYRLESWMV